MKEVDCIHFVPAYDYSEKEIALFTLLGQESLLENPSLPPILVYASIGYYCFIHEHDPDFPQHLVESVRRCNIFLENPTKNSRGTEEFDALIKLEA